MIGDEPTNTIRDRKASEGALPQGEGWSRAKMSSRDTSLHWSSTVCLEVKPVGEPDAGNPHVRFDERGGETERCRMAQATAPLLDSTKRVLDFRSGSPALCSPHQVAPSFKDSRFKVGTGLAKPLS